MVPSGLAGPLIQSYDKYMKNHPVSQMGLVLASFFIFGLSTAFADNCVEGISGLKANADVHSQLSKFGGIDGITGEWKLKGIMGAIAKTNVEFKIQDNSFWVRINRDPLKQVWLCEGDKADVLKVKVLKPKYPKNGTILLKAATENQVQIAASGSGWHFMKFKRVGNRPKSKSSAFIASDK